MAGVCFLMRNWSTEHKWDSGVREIQVKKYYCFMTDTRMNDHSLHKWSALFRVSSEALWIAFQNYIPSGKASQSFQCYYRGI